MSTTVNKPYWWQRLIPRYGNWGGVGWSAGRWNNDPDITNWDFPAQDAMDNAFKWHDWAYQHNLNRNVADLNLVQQLRWIKMESCRAKFYRIGAMIVFSIVPRIRKIRNFW